MSQMVKIPEDKTSLFSAMILSQKNLQNLSVPFIMIHLPYKLFLIPVQKTILKNDVNSAEWHEIDGIDFDGGDFTTYHTQWRNVTCDLSKYSGQVVSIRFMVYD